MVKTKLLAQSVLKCSAAVTAAENARDDALSVLADTGLRDATTYPPVPFGLPVGTHKVTISWKIRSKKIVLDEGSEEETVADGESCLERAIEIIAGNASTAETFTVKGRQEWTWAPLKIDDAIYDARLSQNKGRQRGTLLSKTGENRVTVRIPHA